ncbi:hypothetical protein HKCCSP123_03350 [Rhodobacterales bacterium HKCCSP123]|nr:hypothetical protein [Rhodobacterales bacterium HKCCSP123]
MRWLTAAICLPLVVACGGSAREPIARAYGEAVRELGIYPVFPPREEFQVGDVYFWSQSRSDPSDTISVYVTSLAWMRHEADAFLRSRVVFQNSRHVNNAATPLEQTDFPNSTGRIQTRGEVTDASLLASLPITALPRVSADAGFTAGTGLIGLLASLGLTGGTRTTVTLDFNDVRSYWVPNLAVQARVDDAAPGIVVEHYGPALRELTRTLQLRGTGSADPCGADRVCGMSAITRVYLAREIDYTYRNGSIVAAALRRAETLPETGAATRPPVAPAVTVNVATGADGTLDGAPAQQQIDALRGQLATLTASADRGQSLRFEAWDARGITFSEVYQRPVAVAWDGIEFCIGETIEGGC